MQVTPSHQTVNNDAVDNRFTELMSNIVRFLDYLIPHPANVPQSVLCVLRNLDLLLNAVVNYLTLWILETLLL